MSWWCGKCGDWRDVAVCPVCGQRRYGEPPPSSDWWCYQCSDSRTGAICPECGQKQLSPDYPYARPESEQTRNQIEHADSMTCSTDEEHEMRTQATVVEIERQAGWQGPLCKEPLTVRPITDAVGAMFQGIALFAGNVIVFGGIILYCAFWLSLALLVFWAVWHFVL